MKNVDVIRAWKDASYRNSLSQEQLKALPANPAGQLTDIEQQNITGGAVSWDERITVCSIFFCDMK